MEEKRMSEAESLKLIQQMIHAAKKEQKDDGKGWIVWGWLLFLASVLTIINTREQWFQPFWFWNVFGGIAVIYMIYEFFADWFFKKDKVNTYTGDLFKRLNSGFFISLFFIIVAFNIGTRVVSDKTGSFDLTFITIGFALLINLYSFWILIYGSALNFKPSVIGAYFSWALGLAALFTRSFETVMFYHAAAVMVGYIIPGHIANIEFKKLRREEK